MNNKEQFQWTFHNQANPSLFKLLSFDDAIDDLAARSDQITVITEGWKEGPVTAILRGGVNARSVLDLLAGIGVKDLKIFHLEEKIDDLEDIFLSSVVAPAHQMFDSVSVTWRREPSVHQLLQNIGNEHPMLFFGSPLSVSEILPFYRSIKQVYAGSVTIVRGPLQDMDFDESGEIYKWVRERTFEANDFSLQSVLRNQKRKLGAKIAVILPSLNEEKTVGRVIKTALDVKDIGIVDEVILIDSVSTDNTREIALSYGIPVYQHPEIESGLGAYRGKGEAMFKSAYTTDADIIAWVDTDIENITPSFFYGLLGPMLTYPEIKFSKGYFSRPIRVEASGIELGGGRVTELLARPWLNTFMPQLSGYIQPLAGTAAIYRSEFMKMRIPVNYGVEVAMLLQAVSNMGLWSTCQVNLGEVIHKSKDVQGLSEMSYQILQVLAEMQNLKISSDNVFRRVFSAHGNFEISAKRFPVVWRTF
ncbi:MAG: glucosyl-3-phosphoglycerate synthase [Syntrophomonadaceae bacterium]|nr:glucosyl-3-phosphoglycerate synthase [Syntrophomonadaceae bacterium]